MLMKIKLDYYPSTLYLKSRLRKKLEYLKNNLFVSIRSNFCFAFLRNDLNNHLEIEIIIKTLCNLMLIRNCMRYSSR